MTRKMLSALGLSAAFALSGALAGGVAHAQTAYPKNDYANKANWLCWTGKPGDACAVDLTTTVIKADGSESVETFKADPKAPIDCFYVYPTVSNDPGAVSDMIPGPEEFNVVKAQLARFGSKCRIYAPMYRQFTLTALRAGIAGKPVPSSADPASRTVGYTTTWSTPGTTTWPMEATAAASCSSATPRGQRPDPDDRSRDRRQAGAEAVDLGDPDGHQPADRQGQAKPGSSRISRSANRPPRPAA